MKETSKAELRRYNDYLYKRILSGNGIDIGCGNDVFGQTLFKDQVTCDSFDEKDGDAQNIHLYVSKTYDFAYSSNCLEHLPDPFCAIENWLKIVKPKGFLVVTVPDEDLYEQGCFPSRFNPDHKWTFTISKKSSWSPKSINVVNLLEKFNESIKILRIQIVDSNYDYSTIGDQTRGNAEAFIEFAIQKIGS